jgi:hypothetical protein
MKTRKSKSKTQNIIILSIIYCLLSTVFSCGYAIHSKKSFPFQAIQIDRIENRTDEPKLQDKLSLALTDELLRQGFAVHPGADYHLRGKINLFELRILSETSDIATEYEIVMKGDFLVSGPSGYVRELKDIGSPFIISFSGSGQLTTLLAFKELASERAIRDIAQQIVAALMYR